MSSCDSSARILWRVRRQQSAAPTCASATICISFFDFGGYKIESGKEKRQGDFRPDKGTRRTGALARASRRHMVTPVQPRGAPYSDHGGHRDPGKRAALQSPATTSLFRAEWDRKLCLRRCAPRRVPRGSGGNSSLRAWVPVPVSTGQDRRCFGALPTASNLGSFLRCGWQGGEFSPRRAC